MLQTVVDLIERHLSQLPDTRKVSPNRKYSIRDAALSAFAVFMMQAPSFLAHQRDMERTKGRHNAQSLFRVAHIPSDNQIRNILDPVPASALSELFWQIFAQIEANGYTQVSDLKKNNDGVWIGSAMKGGQKVNVKVDFQGNVTQ